MKKKKKKNWVCSFCEFHHKNVVSEPSNEHSYHVWFQLAQWFWRRRLKCEKFTDKFRPKVMTIAHMTYWVM